jgi:hypothetical protein
MSALSFDKLARELEAAGAAPAIIDRTIQELKDHCADAEAVALERGLSPAAARRQARECLGPASAIVAAISARPALLDWRHRWPHSARFFDSATHWLVLPAASFVYCASHPAGLVRWSVSSSLALCVTGSILFVLQWLIA